jgi:predicted rRNA methylase
VKQNKIYIYGKHAVEEALRHAPQILRKIHLSERMEDKKLRELAHSSGVPIEPLDERKASSQAEGGASHQGIIALISLGSLSIPFEKFLDSFNPAPDTALLFLSEVQDPHNVGSAIRSAAAFGASAVLMPTFKQSPITGAVIKASAGMAFRIPLVTVDNVQQALSSLKKKGVRVHGLSGDAKKSIDTEEFAEPALFVLGNESEGISASAKALCDQMLSVPISPRAESLNVAASGAVALYAWSRKHPNSLIQKYMQRGEVILRFEKVSFEFGPKKPILDEVDFSVRRGTKSTFMGQNGAGKSTIFGLITGQSAPDRGKIIVSHGLTIATSRQVIPRSEMKLTVREFFQNMFPEKVYDIDPKIDDVLVAVNLHAPHDKIIEKFSGGQQARLLLASALIQDPDLLLLDEPTNNLDKAGIEHLTKFLVNYKKTCIVISHDAEFLNSFTDGVLYLDVHTHRVEQYVGDYFDVVSQITARIDKENRKNALLAKEIQENKDKANFFANKGGQMRMVAKRMREKAEMLEEEKVDVRREDKTIRAFAIPAQQDIVGNILTITSFLTIKNHKASVRKANIALRRNQHLLLKGPNGVGKSTLLESIASGGAEGSVIAPGVRVGYYRQDFSNLDFDKTVHQELAAVMEKQIEENLRTAAAAFLITGELVHAKIGSLSEGQKGLVAFARLMLLKPGLLILDEPTNHINFRHLPVIAAALNKYEGAMILVSHVPDFVSQIRIDETLDLDK